MKTSKLIVFASITTSKEEIKYPELDLEALALDCKNSGITITFYVKTDHNPLC